LAAANAAAPSDAHLELTWREPKRYGNVEPQLRTLKGVRHLLGAARDPPASRPRQATILGLSGLRIDGSGTFDSMSRSRCCR
jgi:hypothetical protein